MKVELIQSPGKNAIHVVAEAARWTRTIPTGISGLANFESDAKMIEGLLKMGHEGILEMTQFSFLVTDISRVVTHQLVRHRIASYLQASNRHIHVPNKYIVPPSILSKNAVDRTIYITSMEASYKAYEYLIKHDIPKEDARYLLPPGFFTHITITMNARELCHFFQLRLDKHAQWEIREMAQKMFDLVYMDEPILFGHLKLLRDAST